MFTVKALFYLAVAGFVTWVLHIEGQHNGCYGNLRNSLTACKADCYRIDPHEGDTVEDLIQRLWNYTMLGFEAVYWRRSILYAIVLTLAISIIMRQKLPSIMEFIVSVLILYIIFYQMSSYYSMHVDFRSDNFARHTINQLRENLGMRSPTSAKDFRNI